MLKVTKLYTLYPRGAGDKFSITHKKAYISRKKVLFMILFAPVPASPNRCIATTAADASNVAAVPPAGLESFTILIPGFCIGKSS